MTSVARAIGRQLRTSGVRYVMGHPGGEVVDLIDGLRLEGLDFILTKHETAAAFMADAMGSFEGIPGVCLGTLGPGATNLVTGVAHAYLDRSPVIAMSGQLPADRFDMSTHQKLDLSSIFSPITKWHARVTARNVAPVMARALRVATRHRPGPVYVEVPSDVSRLEARDGAFQETRIEIGHRFDLEQGAHAAALLRTSRRPIILAGLDALRGEASAQLRQFAEQWTIPVMVSPKAKGVFREDHPLFLGTIEMLGTPKLFEYIDGCDLVIMVGFEPVEFDREWSARARIIHIGPLENDDLYYPADSEIVGPVACGVELLLEAAGSPQPKHRSEDVARFRSEFWSYVNPTRSSMTAQQVLAELRQALPEHAVVTCDVGYNKAVTGQCWPVYRPKTFYMSNGLSSMGYGLPAALGLQLLNPGTPVACVLGDGGFAMLMAELETAVRCHLPVLIVVLADEALSQIRLGQERKGVPTTGTTFGPLDYVALARAFGARAREVNTTAECREAFAWARNADTPTIVAAHIDPSAYLL